MVNELTRSDQRDAESVGGADTDEFIEALKSCQTSYDVFRVLKRVCERYGYHSFIVMHLPENKDSILADITMVTNWDPELIRAYDSMKLAADSPIFSHLFQSTLPFYYDLVAINVVREYKQDETLSLFRKFGHLYGVYISCTDRNGQRGAVGLARNTKLADKSLLPDLNYIAIHVYDRLSNISEKTSTSDNSLTAREKECIQWTAAGKTSAETGKILGISENTVNHYLSSAAAKLGTVNKAHTVAKAIKNGLLGN